MSRGARRRCFLNTLSRVAASDDQAHSCKPVNSYRAAASRFTPDGIAHMRTSTYLKLTAPHARGRALSDAPIAAPDAHVRRLLCSRLGFQVPDPGLLAAGKYTVQSFIVFQGQDLEFAAKGYLAHTS